MEITAVHNVTYVCDHKTGYTIGKTWRALDGKGTVLAWGLRSDGQTAFVGKFDSHNRAAMEIYFGRPIDFHGYPISRFVKV